MKIGVLDDYQRCARDLADWSSIEKKVELKFFHEAFASQAELVNGLKEYEVLCLNRERTPFPTETIKQLTGLKHIVLTGRRSTTLDIAALEGLGVSIAFTGVGPAMHATPELAIGLMLALARNIPVGDKTMKSGEWLKHCPLGMVVHGKTLGIVGLGKVGTRVAEIARTLGMTVIAWSPNLTKERADAANVHLAVSKAELLGMADVVSLHMVLSDTTTGIIGSGDLKQLKPKALLINTARGPLVDELALVDALNSGAIGGAAIDVYETEPLQKDHPLRSAQNCILQPHFGYVTEEIYRTFYEETVLRIEEYLAAG